MEDYIISVTTSYHIITNIQRDQRDTQRNVPWALCLSFQA